MIINARRNAERAMFPAAIYDLTRAALPAVGECTELEMTDYNHVMNSAKAALDETLTGLNDKEKVKHMRRVQSLLDTTAKVWNGNVIAKTMMIFYYIIHDLNEHDYMHVIEGSAFADAMMTLLDSLGPWFEQTKLDKSANKQARHLMALLQKDCGLFSGFKGELT